MISPGHMFLTQSLIRIQSRFLVKVSYFEIFDNEIRDLLSSTAPSLLDVEESPDVGFYIKDLSTFLVRNAEDMDRIMTFGNNNRLVDATKVKSQSSKSHAIFSITVETTETGLDGQEQVKVDRLHLVDLAGSRVQRETAVNNQNLELKEFTKIDLPLSTLNNVFSALVDEKCTQIPYKKSKLTHILQDSFIESSSKGMGPNTINTYSRVDSANNNFEKTMSKLPSSRAKNVFKKGHSSNEDRKDALLCKFQKEIEHLKKQLEEDFNTEEGFDDDVDEVDYVEQKTISNRKKSNKQSTKKIKSKKSVHSGPSKGIRNKKGGLGLASMSKHEKSQGKVKCLEKDSISIGGHFLDEVEKQENVLKEFNKVLRERKPEELELLKQQLERKSAAHIDMEEKYSSLQEESVGLSRELRRLQGLIRDAQVEQKEVCAENQRQVEALLEDVTQLNKELSLQDSLLEMYLPDEYKDLITRHAHWNGDIGKWQLKCTAYTEGGEGMGESANNSNPALDQDMSLSTFKRYITFMYSKWNCAKFRTAVMSKKKKVCFSDENAGSRVLKTFEYSNEEVAPHRSLTKVLLKEIPSFLQRKSRSLLSKYTLHS